MARSNYPTTNAMHETLATAQSGAKTRRLESTVCDKAKSVFQAFVRYCDRVGLRNPSLHVDAGGVANSYKYRADTSTITFQTSKEIGMPRLIHFHAGRTQARKVRGGDYGMWRLSASKADEETRTWPEMPAFRYQGKAYQLNNSGYLYL